jgi:hypothetical protein
VLLELVAKGDVSMGSGRFKPFQAIKPRRGTSVARMVIEDRR